MSVQAWMSRFGWTDGGGPGSVKMDANNVQVAVYGDRKWLDDREYAGYRRRELEKARVLREQADKIEAANTLGATS